MANQIIAHYSLIMKPLHIVSAVFSIAFAFVATAKEAVSPALPASVASASQSATIVATPMAFTNPDVQADNKEQEILTAKNKLEAEKLIASTNGMRAQIAQMKMERELLTENLNLEAAKRQASLQSQLAKTNEEKELLSEQAELSKVRADKLTNDLKALQCQSNLEVMRLQNDIALIETTDKRAKFADAKPVSLKNPLKANGMLVISDRRIPLNGIITSATADFVTSRIQYWNNKDRTLPIFIVIDSSPGGSVMAGYRILKAMDSSEAPVHVVVKSFAASMAAAITTLAKESYAYPNALILHHQISSMVSGSLNLTQQKEFHDECERWWARLGTPIARKMGITTDEFIKKMYQHSSSGDWSEFGEQAKELKWVDHVVTGINETSYIKNPDATDAPKATQIGVLAEETDSNGKPFAWLPHLNPMDVYFLYNPDSYYRTR
jgi:ATP-dependent Clp protease protease subunit